MKTMKLMIVGLAAALLATPPADAAPRSGRTPARPAAKALLKKGLAEMKQRDFAAAIQVFSRAASLGPDSRALFLLGYAHSQRGSQNPSPSAADKRDALEGVSAYSQAIAIDPDLKVIADKSRFYRSLAWCYETLGSFEAAAGAYRSALAAAPQNPMIPLQLARAYSRMGRPVQAAESLSASLETARQIGQETLILNTVRRNPKYSSMLAYPDVAAVAAGEAASSGVQVAQSAPLSRGEELRDAVSDQRSAPAREEPLPDPAVTAAMSQADDHFKFRQYRGAIDSYEEAARLDARIPSLSQAQRAVLYERLGTAYNRLGLTQEAVLPLQRSLQAMPENASAHYQLALAYSVSGRFKEALRALDSAFRSAPSRGDLKRYMILAKSDLELEPLRDMGAFNGILERCEELLARR
ncbi:MAG: tetratricopeptide repeat protein [Elusimicrobia bacterium]|nr:tetratricopeptide repeat protein [Elusimicrobiota bacterium]